MPKAFVVKKNLGPCQTLEFIEQFSYNKTILIYCYTINRSISVSKILKYYKIQHYVLKNM